MILPRDTYSTRGDFRMTEPANNPLGKPNRKDAGGWRAQHIIAVVVPTALLVGSHAWSWFHEPKKELTAYLQNETTIASIDAESLSGLKLTFGDTAVDSATAISITVRNTGNLDLFVDPEKPFNAADPTIVVQLPDQAEVLNSASHLTGQDRSTRLNTIPSDSDDDPLRVEIVLMNRQAEFQIDLVVANYKPGDGIDVYATGLGIKSRFIRASSTDSESINVLTLALKIGSAFLMVLALPSLTLYIVSKARRLKE